MKTIQITEDLWLPLDIITMRQAIYGASGAGKTTWARLLAEKIYQAKHRFCAIDLKNDWYGLKSSADGSSEGMPVVIFGGPRADVKLFDDAAAAAALAETVASIDQSVIIDLDDFSRTRQEKFLSAFLDKLYDVNRSPFLLIADEADRYAPQKPMSEPAIMSLSASEDICRRGRKRGIGSAWLTQRTAVLNKNISDLCDLTVIFRTPGSRDLDELEDRVGRLAGKDVVKEVMRQAPGLEDGQAFFLSSHPKLRKYLPSPPRPLQLPMPSTFDSSATPGVGQRRREPKVLAQADLAVIESRMAAQVQRTKEEDPKLLKAELQRLRSELAKAPSKTVTPGKTKVIEKPVVTDKQLLTLDRIIGRLDTLFPKAAGIVAELGSRMTEASTLRNQVGEMINATRDTITRARSLNATSAGHCENIPNSIPDRSGQIQMHPAKSPVAEMQKRRDFSGANGSDMPSIGNSGKRRIMVALAQDGGSVTDRRLSILTGISRDSGTWRTYMAELRGAGWVRSAGGSSSISAEGIAALGIYDPLPTGADLVRYWQGRLGNSGKRRIFDVVVAAYPSVVSKDDLSAATGIATASGTWRTYMAELRGLELIEGSNEIRASDNLFT